MANEFSDFKVRHYDTTSGKLRILKEIFTRLDLSPLQKRYDDLSQKIISLGTQVNATQSFLQRKNPPIAVIKAFPLNGDIPLTVSFDGSKSHTFNESITIYIWDFGDGHTSDLVSPTHIYTDAGYYTVTLTVTDTQFLSGTAATHINAGNVIPPPPPSGNHPDLAIVDVVSNIQTNLVNFQVTVMNVGDEKAPSTSVVGPFGACYVDALDIGESITVNFQYPFDPNGTSTNIDVPFYVTPVPNEINLSNNSADAFARIKNPYNFNDGDARIIVHCHNPEGLELGGIVNDSFWNLGLPITVILTYPSSTIVSAPTMRNEHGVPQTVPVGSNVYATAIFNGISHTIGPFELSANSVTTISFVFPRLLSHLSWDVNDGYSAGTPGGVIQSTYFNWNAITDIGPGWTDFSLVSGHVSLTESNYFFTVDANGNYQLNGDPSIENDENNCYSSVAALSKFFPINLLSQPFAYWFCESKASSYYPSVGIKTDDLSFFALIIPGAIAGNNHPIHGKIADASKIWKKMNFGLVYPDPGYAHGGMNPITLESFSGSLNAQGSVEFFMSSIPHDISGTGF